MGLKVGVVHVTCFAPFPATQIVEVLKNVKACTVIERMDKLWAERGDNSFGTSLPNKPSSYIHHRIYGCVFDDEIGLRNRDVIGMDQICFETDYPHADSTFPHSKKVANDICTQAGLDEEETWKFLRGNAIRAFGLERYGITK